VPALPLLQSAQPQRSQAVAAQPSQTPGLSADQRREIEGVLAELRSIRKILEQSGI
jgi:hypothetical protein